nr:Chain A, Peptide DFINWL from human GLP-2 [Homo sapiens]
DFINWL